MIRKAVFPVAGLGTRMLPATKALPKEMLPVVDRPLIQYAFEEARAAGIEQFIFVTGRGKSVLEDHFDRAYELDDVLTRKGKITEREAVSGWLPAPGELSYTRQPDALGLGHAVWCARHLVGNEPFAVLLVDDLIIGAEPCLRQMVEAFATTRGNLVAVEEVPQDQTDRYGVLDPLGVFEHLSLQQKGAGGEIQLTDAMARMIGRVPFHGMRFSGRRFDCGGKLGYLEAMLACALEREDLRDGVREILRRYR